MEPPKLINLKQKKEFFDDIEDTDWLKRQDKTKKRYPSEKYKILDNSHLSDVLDKDKDQPLKLKDPEKLKVLTIQASLIGDVNLKRLEVKQLENKSLKHQIVQ